jgi:hypothetical protein
VWPSFSLSKKMFIVFFRVFILWFFSCVCVCVCLKKMFSYMLHTANTLTCFEYSFFKK